LGTLATESPCIKNYLFIL